MAAFAPCPVGQGARRAGEGPLPVKGDSFRIERIPLGNPEEKFWGRFDSAPRPLLRPKEGLRPFLWKPSRRVRGFPKDGRGRFAARCGGRWDGGRGSRAGCLRSFRAVRRVEDEGGDGLAVLAPALGGRGPAGDESKTGVTDCQGSALSAGRGAGPMRFLPDILRVQHGVRGSEV